MFDITSSNFPAVGSVIVSGIAGEGQKVKGKPCTIRNRPTVYGAEQEKEDGQ